MVLVEGTRVLNTAMDHGAELAFVVVDEAAADGPLREVVDRVEAEGADLVPVPATMLREFADTESPQGILAVAREPRPSPLVASQTSRALVVDAVQDPGNLGALLRVAAALGVDRVLALDGTVDPWNPKVVRASAGHAFGLPVDSLTWDEAVGRLREARLPLLVAAASGRDVRAWSRKPSRGTAEGFIEVADSSGAPERWALLVGNEASGPRPEALAAASAQLAIPMVRGVDSLNVAMAASILLWTLGPGRGGSGADRL